MPSLNEDCFIVMSGFVDTLADLVRLWIALGCVLPAHHVMWKEMLREHCIQKLGGQDLEEIILRLGCRQDSTGLLLIERMYVRRKCSRSGCFRIFREIDNHRTACSHHSGILRKGRLSCCHETSFRGPGCKDGYHDGALHESLFLRRVQEQEEKVEYKSS